MDETQNSGRRRASVSETGHYKNVVNLNALKVFVEGLGGQYNPQKEILSLSNLALLVDETNALHNDVKDQFNTVTLGIDRRQVIFSDVKSLSGRIVATMGSTNVTPKTIEDAKFILAKIRGTRIGKTNGINSVSVSRLSYDSIYENFRSLRDLLKQDGKYNPQEFDFSIAGISQKESEMLSANRSIQADLNDLATKRNRRNARFYVGDDCLIAVARAIKLYIRGKFGVKSPEFRQVKTLVFKDLGIK